MQFYQSDIFLCSFSYLSDLKISLLSAGSTQTNALCTDKHNIMLITPGVLIALLRYILSENGLQVHYQSFD